MSKSHQDWVNEGVDAKRKMGQPHLHRYQEVFQAQVDIAEAMARLHEAVGDLHESGVSYYTLAIHLDMARKTVTSLAKPLEGTFPIQYTDFCHYCHQPISRENTTDLWRTIGEQDVFAQFCTTSGAGHYARGRINW